VEEARRDAGVTSDSGQIRALNESRKVALIRRFVDAFNRMDFDSVRSDVHPDVELHEWPQARGARTYHGWDAVREGIDGWFEAWEWITVELIDMVEAGERILFSLHQRAKGKGSEIELEITSFNVYTFRDGKLIRMELFIEREPAVEAAGLPPEHQEEMR
jgi:ketosteroid isomerase-like protein